MLNTTLIYIEKDGAYLMLHRVKKEKDINRDKWIGIGGKCEMGESPEECALRETAEETGLTPTDLAYRGIVTFLPLDQPQASEYMHLFTATRTEGTLCRDCDEGDLQYVPKEEILSLNLWEGDRIFLRLLDSEPRFFSLKLVYQGDKLVSHTLRFGGL